MTETYQAAGIRRGDYIRPLGGALGGDIRCDAGILVGIEEGACVRFTATSEDGRALRIAKITLIDTP